MILAAIVVFIASFCTLVIELVAGRVLAPYVGVSLYTWTSIIGVVLAGISGGAYAGGKLADRRSGAAAASAAGPDRAAPLHRLLAWLLVASGIAAMLIAPATTMLEGLLTTYGVANTLLQRVVVLSFLLFFVPSFLLGMISPVAVKLAVRELDTTGSVVGKIYAVSTLGSIAGTFVTGFWLVARFGSRATLMGTGIVLIATALLVVELFGRYGRAAGVLMLLTGIASAGMWPGALPPPHQDALLQPVLEPGIIHSEESQYFTIRVERTIRPDTGSAMHA
ncbi:MAG TPA: fused MFS/spermidine synthase, partial [Thermoanaerobaculia bacterium]|nr:fused MFS/spermidine synthase [Thermoanaerobaculia bacterium]